MSDPVWVFFAAQAKPSSMRRALPDRISETQPVVVVDQAISVVRSKSIPPFKLRCKRDTAGNDLTLYQPLHLPAVAPGTKRAARALNRLLLRRDIDRLLPPSQDRIVCYDSPTQDYLVKKLDEERSIYLAIDDRTLTVTGEPIEGELEAERRLLRKVDGVICVSDYLAKAIESRMQPGIRIPIHVLSNGYDERLFDPGNAYPEPYILSDIPRPRVLVTGHVSDRIDWGGIVAALRTRPEWTWVFVGPADPGMPERIRQMSAKASSLGGSRYLPRMVWHDRAPLEDIPALIAHTDACAVPYHLNRFTLASSPLKAIEYLAMGAAILSTRVPSLLQYGNSIQWVDEGDGDGYARALDWCIDVGSQPMRRKELQGAVRADSWNVRANQFRGLVLNGNG